MSSLLNSLLTTTWRWKYYLTHSAAVMALYIRELFWALDLSPAASKQWPWVSHLGLPNLAFFICQVEESTTISAFQVFGEDYKRCVLQEFSNVWNVIKELCIFSLLHVPYYFIATFFLCFRICSWECQNLSFSVHAST